MWLPVSCKNQAAVTAYHDALIRSSHNDEAAFKKKMNEAVTLSPEFFLPGVLKALWDPAKQDAVLAMPVAELTRADGIMRDVIVKLRENQQADLMAVANSLTAEYPKTVEAYIMADYLMFHMNNWEGVVKFSKKMTEAAPDFGPGYHWLGYGYLNTGCPEKALKAFNTYAALSPEEAKPYDAIADAYAAMHEFSKAADYYEKAAGMGRESSKYNLARMKGILENLNFTDEQKELWAVVEQSWKYQSEGNVDAFSKYVDDNYIGWNNFADVVFTKADLLKMVKENKFSYKITPLAVKITGKAAVVAYYLLVNYPNQTIKGRNCEFYINENGSWKFLGDNTNLEVVKEKGAPEI